MLPAGSLEAVELRFQDIEIEGEKQVEEKDEEEEGEQECS
jgi:hypothetical protein